MTEDENQLKRDTAADKFFKLVDQIREYDAGTPEDYDVMTEALHDMLDNLLGNDFFGTEGQLDPRGDHRDLNIRDL